MKVSNELFDLEAFLNRWLQRLAPTWYANQAVRQIALNDIGILNPSSYLAHRWMSLTSIISTCEEGLPEKHPVFSPLKPLLQKLLVSKKFDRLLNLTTITGVEVSSQDDKDYASLAHWAVAQPNLPPCSSADEFDALINQHFGKGNTPPKVVYREWDGRYYWINSEEPVVIATIARFATEKQREARVKAEIHVESVHEVTLERIRQQFWWLLLAKEQANIIHALLDAARLPVVVTNFESRRDDLAFLITPKHNPRLNRILLTLIQNKSSQEIVEFGRFLSRHHYAFRNQ
jgi:hypothetical protein